METKKGKIYFVENLDGRQFVARILEYGDKYGLDYKLTHEEKDKLLIEFYDATYGGNGSFDMLGQFVARYYLKDFMNNSGGLDLYGGEPAWKITAINMRKIQNWVRRQGFYTKE